MSHHHQRPSRNGGGINRRGFLGGMAAVLTLGLPWLEEAQASTGEPEFQDRFVRFHWGNGYGVDPTLWHPTGVGAGNDWELSHLLSPLAPHKSYLTVLTGLETALEELDPHWSGAAGLYTGRNPKDPLDVNSLMGPTVDQVIADHLHALHNYMFRSLELGVGVAHSWVSRGENQSLPIEMLPWSLFQRLFGSSFRPGDQGHGIVDPRVGLRRSVLDFAMNDIRHLQVRVSHDDRQRLERHFESLRALEQRVARLAEQVSYPSICQKPDEPPRDFPVVNGTPPLREINRLMAEIIAMAIACNLTSVVSLDFVGPATNYQFPGTSGGHHGLTHDEPGNQPQVQSIVLQGMQAFGDLLSALSSIPEGNGNLLDHMLVIAASEVSNGRTHSLKDIPIVVAGSANGLWIPNQHRRVVGGRTSELMLAIMQMFGVNISQWGEKDNLATRGIDGLRA